MKKLQLVLFPSGEKPIHSRLIFIFITILYLYNFHSNDIWTPNESFYAEAVREMFESGNFLDIQYNYEPRYNKPPLTYWVIASSAWVFGLNEFGIRLPIVLMALASIWVTYLLGKQLYGQKGGFYSMLVMALGLQLLAVKQYASPEIPLTFFFTLTLYWFIKAYDQRSNTYIIGSYIALGLTVLTKGFPYIFVIGGIIGLFLIWKNRLDLRELWRDIVFLKLPIGIPLVGIIGLSWIIFMYLTEGQAFWDIYYHETFGRAFDRPNRGLKLTFYLEVLTWSVLPYSLTFIYAIYYWFKHREKGNRNLLLWSWLTVMLVIFTIAQGKIPTYMIQAHSAIAVIVAATFLRVETSSKWFKLSLIFPSLLLLFVSGVFLVTFEMSNVYWLLLIMLSAVFILAGIEGFTNRAVTLLPFWSMACFLVLLNTFLPKVEELRPYDLIGEQIESLNIPDDIPLLLDAWQIHNLPFYTERKTLKEQHPELINEWNETHESTLALIPTEHLNAIKFEYQTLWTGLIYNSSSESQFYKFLMASKEGLQGNHEKFKEFALIWSIP